jgi:tetratricopeptide (TPR) repeat protein
VVPALLCLLVLGTTQCARAQEPGPAALIERGHWKRARTLVDEHLRKSPNDPEYLFFQSQIRNAFGDHSTPLPLAEEAASLAPNVARYHRQLAEVIGVMAQYANPFRQLLLARRFRKEIDAALALDSRDVQANRDLLEFYLLAPGIAGGDRRQAAEVARQIANFDAAEGYLAEARIAGAEKRTADAHASLRRAVETSPGNYRARMALALFDMQPEHRYPDEAETQAKAALAIDSGRADAYAILAEVYAQQGRWSALDALLSDSARGVPDGRIAWFRAAESIIGSGHDLGKAEQYLRTYLGQEPEGNEPPASEAKRELTRVAVLEKRSPGGPGPSEGNVP